LIFDRFPEGNLFLAKFLRCFYSLPGHNVGWVAERESVLDKTSYSYSQTFQAHPGMSPEKAA